MAAATPSGHQNRPMRRPTAPAISAVARCAAPLDRLIAYGRARVGFLISHREIARAALDGSQPVPAGPETSLSRMHIRMLLGQMLGYAACFEGALGVVGRRERVETGDASIDSRVSLLPTEDRGFKLAVELHVTLPQIQDPEQAARLVAAARLVCPYSNATRGNIEVKLTANGHDAASRGDG